MVRNCYKNIQKTCNKYFNIKKLKQYRQTLLKSWIIKRVWLSILSLVILYKYNYLEFVVNKLIQFFITWYIKLLILTSRRVIKF